MAKLEKVDLGAPGTGVGGDTPRSANERMNRNVDILSSQAALTSVPLITSPQALTVATHMGKRVSINLANPGVVNMPKIADLADQDGVILLRNLGSSVVMLAPAIGTNDWVGLSRLNPGDAAMMDGFGGGWNVLMRGRARTDDEAVVGKLTIGGALSVAGGVAGDLWATGRLSGVNGANLLINGSGELGNTGWNGTTFGAVQGGYGEGTIFINASAINTGTWVVDASKDIPCGPGIPLTLSAEITSMGLNAGRAYVKCEAFKADGGFIGLVTGTPANTAKQGYTFQSGTGTTPDGTASVRVSKVADSAPNISAFGVAFRRIKLERGNGVSLYSQEASIGYLGGAPAFSGVPSFAGYVPWHSGSLPKPMTLDSEQTVTGIKRFTSPSYFNSTTSFGKAVTIYASAPDGNWANSPLVISGYPGVGSIGLGSTDAAIVVRCAATSGTLDVVTYNSAAFAPISAAAFNVNSDGAIKSDVETLDNVTERIKRLRGVRYVMKSDASRVPQLGLIAQEVALAFPEAVIETSMLIDESGETVEKGGRPMLAVNYSALVGPLIQAFIELEERLSTLEPGTSK